MNTRGTQRVLFAGGRRFEVRLNKERTRRLGLLFQWERGKILPWLMLNPSVAGLELTTDNLDPTLRRVLGFTRAMKYCGFAIYNLYSLIATDPHGLSVEDPRDLHHDLEPLRDVAGANDVVVAAWGANPKAEPRLQAAWHMFEDNRTRFVALGTTQAGWPRHPLYLPKTARPRPWQPPWPDGRPHGWERG